MKLPLGPHFKSPTAHHELRRVLLLEIVLIFAFYVALFSITRFILTQQNEMTNRILNRMALAEEVQSLERQALERNTSLRHFLLTRNEASYTDFKSSHETYELTRRSLQRRVTTIPIGEASHLDQEQAVVGTLQATQASHTLVLEQLTGRSLSAGPIQSSDKSTLDLDLRHLELQEATLASLSGWRSLIRSDVLRLTDLLVRYRYASMAVLSVQALLVVVSLVIIAYTYVSPAFEKLLQKVVKQNEELRRLDTLKDEFVSVASHQLRTPLSELKWTLTLLARKTKGTNETVTALLGQAKESTEIMIRLVANLLNLSRIEEGRLRFDIQKVDLLPVLKTVVRDAKSQALKKKVMVTHHLPETKSIASIDPLLFRQVVQNLIDNAIAYNKEGGTVTVSLAGTAKEWVVTVVDTGKGMSREDLKRIFTKFYRSSEAVAQSPDGSGLGLYFSEKIMKKLHGSIDVQSVRGQGSTFTIRLPRYTKS